MSVGTADPDGERTTMRPNVSIGLHSRHQKAATSQHPHGHVPLLLAIMACMVAGLSGARADDYVLGPQDKLKIRVFEWRPVTGTAFEWTPLNGEFVVSAGGSLSLPLIGSVPAAGFTSEQISETIGERLQTQIGLQKRPVASVEISEYRPFFVTGRVTKPGKYAYGPGLTVVQALSMAGGTSGLLDPGLVGLQREALLNRGDVRTLEVERLGLLARQARLDAILQDKPTVTFPVELTSRAGQAVVDRATSEEQALFEARRRSMNAEIDSLDQTKVLAANQIQALRSKASSLEKQTELANKELGGVSKLASEGLTVSSRLFGASQNVSELESRNLDVALAILKAQQDVAKVDRDIADLRNRYRVDALTEATNVRSQLAANAEKMETARTLLRNVEMSAPVAANQAIEDEGRGFVTTIDRVVAGEMRSLEVDGNAPVLPGDVVRVEKRREALRTKSDSTPSHLPN